MQTSSSREAGRPAQKLITVGSVSKSVLAARGGFAFDRAYFFDPEHRWEQDKRIARFIEASFPFPLYNLEANLVQPDCLPIPFRQVGGLQPNLILGAALNADFVFFRDRDADISHPPLRGMTHLDRLKGIKWEEREPIRTFLEQVHALKTRYRQDVDVFPPFFWDRSGRATVHGLVTTAHKLMGEEFYLRLHDDLDSAKRFLEWIAQTYVALIRLFSERAEIPVTSIHIGECSGCMVSPTHWAKAIIPATNILVDACGPVRLHSCGNSNRIVEQMAKVHNLATLNVGTNTSVALCRRVVGENIRLDLIPDPQMLCFGTPEDCRAWVERSLLESGNGPLEIRFHVDAAVPEHNVAAMFDTVTQHGYPPYDESLVKRWGA